MSLAAFFAAASRSFARRASSSLRFLLASSHALAAIRGGLLGFFLATSAALASASLAFLASTARPCPPRPFR